MIMCLRVKLISGHSIVVQSILSKAIPLHEPPWEERLLVDSPTPQVFEQVVHCDHCVQVPITRLPGTRRCSIRMHTIHIKD